MHKKKIEKYENFIKKIVLTFGLLMIYIIGQSIPLPGYVISLQYSNGSSIEKLLALTTGGVFRSPTLFSLGMGPYMIVSILISILLLADRDRAAEYSQSRKGRIQVFATFLMALLQAIPIAFNLRNSVLPTLSNLSELNLLLITVLSLSVGGMLISWIASINSTYGLGGPFILILPGIIGGLTKSLATSYSSVLIHPIRVCILIFITIIFVFAASALYSAEYRMDVQRIGIDRRSRDAYSAFRILMAGTMPLMFATTIMYVPRYLTQFFQIQNKNILNYFNLDHLGGIIIYALVIYMLGILFSFVNIMPSQIADDLKESGDYILNVTPGNSTKKFITKRVILFSVFGNLFLSAVVTLPLFFGIWANNKVYTSFSNYFAMLFVLIAIFDNLRQDIDFIYYKDNYNLFDGSKKRKIL
jgi:preprotein translocase subunit SecY